MSKCWVWVLLSLSNLSVKEKCKNIHNNYSYLDFSKFNILFYNAKIKKWKSCFVATAVNTVENVVLKLIWFSFSNTAITLLRKMAPGDFFVTFSNSFLRCVLKVRAFIIEITSCKLYKPSQKCLFLEDDKFLFISPLRFNNKLLHLALWLASL